MIASTLSRSAGRLLYRQGNVLVRNFSNLSERSKPTKALNLISSRSMASAAAPAVSLGNALKNLAEQMPEKDCVRYEHKNVKWSFKHVEYFADCLATGFVEQGLQPGDKVLSWLPAHFSEQVSIFIKIKYLLADLYLRVSCPLQHILQFACSKAGFILYSLDPKLAITDKEASKKELGSALEVTEANVLVTQEAGDDVHYAELVQELVPETRIFDVSDGHPFFTPRYPHLRVIVQTGYEIGDNYGMQLLKHVLVPSGQLETFLGDANISGKTPIYGELVKGANGMLTKGKVLSNEEVMIAGVWPTVTSILKKEYTEVEGVGVIF